MPHGDCPEGKTLLDSYLTALAKYDAVGSQADRAALDLAIAKSKLESARREYWKHIERHKCRVEQGES